MHHCSFRSDTDHLCALLLFTNLGLGSEVQVWVQLSNGLVNEEVLEADIERDAISLEF